MITGGRLGDLFGQRRLFVHGTLGFAITSLLCALAANPGELVAARLAQGFTGALMIPQILALITATFPPEQRSEGKVGLGLDAAAAQHSHVRGLLASLLEQRGLADARLAEQDENAAARLARALEEPVHASTLRVPAAEHPRIVVFRPRQVVCRAAARTAPPERRER
jgi:hypothetical protein